MASTWLTANLVEQIHKAHLRGRSTSEHVAILSNTTLSGLVEYGCLKRSVVGLPSLPASITNSPLGAQLSHVVSEIGLKTNGESLPISTDHRPRDIEFAVVRNETELLSEPVELMFMRMTQATKQAGFTNQTANALQAAFSEMLANAIEHAASPIPILAGYHIRQQIASFIVADAGRGVFDTLRENPDHRDVADHCEAIRRGLRDGVSRYREPRGNGFRPIFQAIMENWGVLRFRSRKGCLTMDGTGLTADQGTNHYPPELPGFQVAVTCRASGLSQEFPLI